ncbi:MAG: hypothetical protein R3B49_00745 [Phycisphaerales bacterium]
MSRSRACDVGERRVEVDDDARLDLVAVARPFESAPGCLDRFSSSHERGQRGGSCDVMNSSTTKPAAITACRRSSIASMVFTMRTPVQTAKTTHARTRHPSASKVRLSHTRRRRGSVEAAASIEIPIRVSAFRVS